MLYFFEECKLDLHETLVLHITPVFHPLSLYRSYFVHPPLSLWLEKGFPFSVRFVLYKLSAYLFIDLRKKRDLSFKCFMTALLRGNHLPNNQIPLWHQLRWKWLRMFHVNIFSKFLLNHLHIGHKYSLCMAETSFWHRRDRNCTHLSTTTFINIIQLLHFYQQMAHK